MKFIKELYPLDASPALHLNIYFSGYGLRLIVKSDEK